MTIKVGQKITGRNIYEYGREWPRTFIHERYLCG